MSSNLRPAIQRSATKSTARWGIALLAASFALRGVFLDLSLPYGDPLDEPYHYSNAAYVEAAGRPPRAAEPSIPAEALHALGWLPRCEALPGAHISWKDFDSMSSEEQAERFREAFRFDASRRSAFVAPNWEAQQPPLAYIGAAAVLRLSGNATLDRRLLGLRLLATALASLAVPLVFAFFRRFLPRKGALAATAAYVAFPGVGAFVGRFSNDALALPIVTATLVVLADMALGRFSRRKAAMLALLLAAGCWTKLYVLVILPAAPIVALFAPRNRRWVIFRRAGSSAAAALLGIVPWLARQHAVTGDWFGLTPSTKAVQMGLGVLDQIRAVPDLLHLRFAVVFGRSFLWPGTWSAMGAPAAVAVVLTLSLLALVLGPIASRERSTTRRRAVQGVAVVLPFFALGQIAYASTFAAIGRHAGHPPTAGPDGWYALILLPIVLALGCAMGSRPGGRLLLAAAGIFLAAETIVILGVLPSVYRGSLEPNGSNAPFLEYIRILGRPDLALSAFSRVGLSRPPQLLLGCLLAGSVLTLLAGAALSIRRPARPSGSSVP